MDLQTAGITLSQSYQQMASTPRDTGSPEIRVKEIEPQRRLLLSGDHDPFMPNSTNNDPHDLLAPLSPENEESLEKSVFTPSHQEFKFPCEESLTTIFMDLPLLAQNTPESLSTPNIAERSSTSALEVCEESHDGDKRTRAKISEQRRRSHHTLLYQNLRDALGTTASTPKQTIITVCIELFTLCEDSSLQPRLKPQKKIKAEEKDALTKQAWHSYLERKRRNQLKESLADLKDCLKLAPSTNIKETLTKCLEKINTLKKQGILTKINFNLTLKKRKISKKPDLPSTWSLRQESHQKAIPERKANKNSKKEKNRAVERENLEQLKAILKLPKKSTRQVILANSLHFILHKEKPSEILVKKTLCDINRMTNNKKKHISYFKASQNIERFLIARIKNELNKLGFSIGGNRLQNIQVLSCLLSWISTHRTNEGKPSKDQNKAHIVKKIKNSSSDQENGTSKKKHKPFSADKMHLHHENNSQDNRSSGMTPPPILSTAQNLLTEPENSFPQPNVSVEHLTAQSSLRQLQSTSQPEEEAIYDYRNTVLYADNTALPDSPGDRTPPEVVVTDLNHPTLIQFVTPPQAMGYGASSFDIAPQSVGNMANRDFRNPEIKSSDRRQSLLASHDEILEARSNEIQTSKFLQHRVTQQDLLTGTTQSNKSASQKLEEKNSPQSSLLLNVLQNPLSDHFQDSPRLTDNPHTLKTDHSHSFEMSDRNMTTSSRLCFIANHGSPEKPTISSVSLKSKLPLRLADEAEASKETVNPEKFSTFVQSKLREIAKENDELREKMERIQKEFDDSTERRIIDLEENSRLKEQVLRLEKQLTQFKKHEPTRVLAKFSLSAPPLTHSQRSTNNSIPPTVFEKVKELSELFELPDDVESDMHQLDKVLEGAIALARECKMNHQPFFGQLKDNIPAFIKTQNQNSLLTLIAEKGSQINVIRKLLDNIKEKASIGKSELDDHLKQIQRDIEYLKEKILILPSAQTNRKKTMTGQADQLTTLNIKTRDFFEKKDILIKQLIENLEEQLQVILEETKHYQAAMDN